MSRLIFLYDETNFGKDDWNIKNKIYKFLLKKNVKIKLMDNTQILLENGKKIIFKKLNCNRANDFKKYKNDLLFYNSRLTEKMIELENRCNTRLTSVECWYYNDNGLLFYCKDSENIIQKRYWVYCDGIMRETLMVTDEESTSPVIERYWINKNTEFFLNKSDAIKRYSQKQGEYLKELKKDKEAIEEDFKKKLSEMDVRISKQTDKISNPLYIPEGQAKNYTKNHRN